jgi:hypothetical protein
VGAFLGSGGCLHLWHVGWRWRVGHLGNGQAFSFGDYLSGKAYWPQHMPVSAASPQPLVIWLHPYSYNTGYAPTYGQASAWEEIANAGFVVMAYDQIGFGLRNSQGGVPFYSRWAHHSMIWHFFLFLLFVVVFCVFCFVLYSFCVWGVTFALVLG